MTKFHPVMGGKSQTSTRHPERSRRTCFSHCVNPQETGCPVHAQSHRAWWESTDFHPSSLAKPKDLLFAARQSARKWVPHPCAVSPRMGGKAQTSTRHPEQSRRTRFQPRVNPQESGCPSMRSLTAHGWESTNLILARANLSEWCKRKRNPGSRVRNRAHVSSTSIDSLQTFSQLLSLQALPDNPLLQVISPKSLSLNHSDFQPPRSIAAINDH